MTEGDIRVHNDKAFMFDGHEWQEIAVIHNNEVERFANANKSVHDEHPELKKLWEEYVILRKLKGI